MPFQEKDSLRFYQFDIFSKKIIQGVFTRRGGVSAGQWASLNVGGSVGDDPGCVKENRLRTFAALRRPPASIHDVWLVHGIDIVYADAPRPLDQPSAKADILLTDNPDVTLFMRFGDCVPILYHDPVKRVIGMAHAGWQGTVKGVAGEAVRAMQTRYGSKPADIIVGIGPSIGLDHYEVGPEVVEQFQDRYGAQTGAMFSKVGETTHLDLWEANRIELQNAGVNQVEISGICTGCHPDDWFSHRVEKGKTGRFGALMAMQA